MVAVQWKKLDRDNNDESDRKTSKGKKTAVI